MHFNHFTRFQLVLDAPSVTLEALEALKHGEVTVRPLDTDSPALEVLSTDEEIDLHIDAMLEHDLEAAPLFGRFLGRGLAGMAIKAGDRVRVPKGVEVTGTAADLPKANGATRWVRVHRASAGHINHFGSGRSLRQPHIVWAGSGGYWHEIALFPACLEPGLAVETAAGTFAFEGTPGLIAAAREVAPC